MNKQARRGGQLSSAQLSSGTLATDGRTVSQSGRQAGRQAGGARAGASAVGGGRGQQRLAKGRWVNGEHAWTVLSHHVGSSECRQLEVCPCHAGASTGSARGPIPLHEGCCRWWHWLGAVRCGVVMGACLEASRGLEGGTDHVVKGVQLLLLMRRVKCKPVSDESTASIPPLVLKKKNLQESIKRPRQSEETWSE